MTTSKPISKPISKPTSAKRKHKKNRGKILRVKQGYNPNSSSMGSIIFVLPAALLGITAIFGAVSGFLSTVLLRRIEKPDNKISALYLKLQNRFFKSTIQGKNQ